MTVELITAATPEIHEAMGRLIPQLSRSAAPMSAADVERFLSQSGVHLFVFRPDTADAEGNHPILGMLSLATFEIPTGVRAWIEDVVVDLTSRPSREAANRLYQRAGFQLRETNVYRVTLEKK